MAMQSSVTLKQLKERALDYADMTGTSFPDPDRLNDYANASLSELHDMLASSFGADYYWKSYTLDLSSGTESYALPDDFYKLTALYYTTSERRFKMERFNPIEIDGYRTSPISGGSAEIWYVPAFKRLRTDKSVIEGVLPPGWEDFVAWDIAVRLLVREESDASAHMAERERQRARIIQMLTPRDEHIPDSIGDYYGRWMDTRHLLRFDERYFKYRILGTNIHFIEIEYIGV